MVKMRLLITAGPTREHLDPVRFLSNASSGRLGCALAAAARADGHRVTLVLGPCTAEPPEVDELIPATSAQDMFDAVSARFDACDALVAAAAPCDFRLARRRTRKIKKGDGPLVLELERTPDILAEMAARRTEQILVGFCLETEDLEERARAKLRAKNLDLIVANRPEAMAAETQDALLLAADGNARWLRNLTKEDLAAEILAAVSALSAGP